MHDKPEPDDLENQFKDQFNDINPDDIELDIGFEAIVHMYKSFRDKGLSIIEAAALTAAIVTKGM